MPRAGSSFFDHWHDGQCNMNIVSLRLVHPTDLLISLDVRPREQSVSEAARRLHPSAPASSTNSLRSNPPCRGLGGRLDRSRIVALGHSLGGHTVGRLAGMRVTDPADGEEENLIDPRIQAAVRLGAPGSGANLAAFASKHLPGRGHPPARTGDARCAPPADARFRPDRRASPRALCRRTRAGRRERYDLRTARKIAEPKQTKVFRTARELPRVWRGSWPNPPPARARQRRRAAATRTLRGRGNDDGWCRHSSR